MKAQLPAGTSGGIATSIVTKTQKYQTGGGALPALETKAGYT
jgi:hypothetical protein